MDYFNVELQDEPNVKYLVTDNGSEYYTDINGNVISVTNPITLSFGWCAVRESWMEPLPVPESNAIISRFDFLNRFTREERIAIQIAAETNAAIKDYLLMINMSHEIDLNLAATQNGLAWLEMIGLIGVNRASVIGA